MSEPMDEGKLECLDDVLQAAMKAVGDTVSGGTRFKTDDVIERAMSMIAEDPGHEEIFLFLAAYALYTRLRELVRDSGGAPILPGARA
jgi:hypothetical protein